MISPKARSEIERISQIKDPTARLLESNIVTDSLPYNMDRLVIQFFCKEDYFDNWDRFEISPTNVSDNYLLVKFINSRFFKSAVYKLIYYPENKAPKPQLMWEILEFESLGS